MSSLTRVAARILLLDPLSRVLLFEGRDLSDPADAERFWFTVGGGVEEGESLIDAAARELAEETGRRGLALVGPFHRREVDFLDHGEPRRQIEYYFAARTRDSSLSREGWTELEKATTTRWRWWTVDELRDEDATSYPENLAELVLTAAAMV